MIPDMAACSRHPTVAIRNVNCVHSSRTVRHSEVQYCARTGYSHSTVTYGNIM
jgi:putative hemolysin